MRRKRVDPLVGLGKSFGTSSVPSRELVDCLCFAAPPFARRCAVRSPINDQLRTGTDKGNPTV